MWVVDHTFCITFRYVSSFLLVPNGTADTVETSGREQLAHGCYTAVSHHTTSQLSAGSVFKTTDVGRNMSNIACPTSVSRFHRL